MEENLLHVRAMQCNFLPWAQGRVGRRLQVVLRYVAGTGLINQHYSHIAALSLAAVLGAEVVLPPAMHRSSFEHVFSVSTSAAWELRDSSVSLSAMPHAWNRHME